MSDLGQTQLLGSQPTADPRLVKVPVNVLVVGVGGQGVIMISKVLATLCQQQGFQVKQSEVHGMAKRGGSVFSHVRFGEQVYSPTIPQGQADVLVALEWAEGLRWLPYLKPGTGIFIADTQQIVPPFACRDRKHGARSGYAKESVADISELISNCFAADAGKMATELGNAKAANTLLLGMLSTALDFPADAWREVIARFVPPRTVDTNMEAFSRGRDWVERYDPAALDGGKGSARGVPEGDAPHEVQFELPVITEAWCKSCNICVKFCPERCLSLDENQIAVLSRPDLCTLCRICERLCPDFAIALNYKN
ncbi:MAG: 2-oxoacid:acceptor oxidoreductase family protein [Gammaproteobacteria bacterium]|jgi:indolepyruvate ferredoxin oxidoreductase beta subunit|nr:2-oxoacid:acceptor oxidoreductase family protein [Gammaproteobacteria bacterium]MBP6051901.1 2-oxoacid:acceptor oxidoreductase family protein [Pseudomonadales bacterium]MBK6581879.1 2-oxoacid:acceptor oxidoreductase family protein [Gammaproteobacteria bacterium]MBK7169415.1 2-oxoacid:acceptor oxidoreductase family protein [Gammaproteobacteria bacterium]MBK7520714.1 2-oxoacid:acceptor oxidoreductase family protein [Gammaproteobacteria bacterium]